MSPSPLPANCRHSGRNIAIASMPDCSAKLAGHHGLAPGATSVDRHLSSRTSVPHSSTSAMRPQWSRPNALDRRENELSPAPLDGNAAAGDLTDVFAFEVTTSVTHYLRRLSPHSPSRHAGCLPGGTRRGAALRLLQRRSNPPRPSPATSMARPSGVDMIAILGPVTNEAMPSAATSSRG